MEEAAQKHTSLSGAFSKVKILDKSINRLSYDSSFPASINAIEFGPTRVGLLTKGRIFV